MTARLDRLLRPRTIAVVGGAWAEQVVEQCDRFGFAGPTWPVHPTKESVRGRPCIRAIEDLPQAPDATFIGVNRAATVEIVRALAARGAGGAVCFASGFGEAADVAGAAALQDDLVAVAGGMPIIGPNCYGLLNALDGVPLWPDQHGLQRVERGVAILTQSSNIAITLSMQRRGLPIAYLLTAGNQAQTGLSDLALAALEDARVTALGLHIEGLDDVRAFERLALRARALGKPVVALKAGRSLEAQAAVRSHTASLAGSEAAAAALFRRLGIGQVATLSALLETLKLLHVHGPLGGADLCAMCCSGGEAALLADGALGHRVRFRALTPERKDAVKATLNDLVAVANPLDYHTFIWGDEARLEATFRSMMTGGFDLSLLALDFPRGDRCDDTEWTRTLRAFETAARDTRAKAAVVATLPETLPEAYAADMMARGIVPLLGIEDALTAAEAARAVGRAWAAPAPAAMLATASTSEPITLLDEHEAKGLLARSGVPVPEGRRVTTAEAAVAAAEALGYPVALKALGVAHKTEAGAVALDLRSVTGVRAAFAALEGKAEAFLVERMAGPCVAELIVGAVRDPVCGVTLTIGAGGTLTELLDDAATLILPTSENDLMEALGALRIATLLDGYRGQAAADVPALISAVLAVARFVEDHAAWLEELDINPLRVGARGDGVIAVDAFLRLRVKEEP